MNLFITIFFFSFLSTSIFAIEPGQWDNFQDGTTQGWGSGAPNPNPPVIMLNGGPGGDGDTYLLVRATGSAGAGSKLITFNTDQWSGDYLSAAISSISMHMNNLGNVDLSMRISVQGPGGNFWSISPAELPAQSGWQVVHFSLDPADLTGGTNLNQTLSEVIQLRILHSITGSSAGDVITANLGIDNISAAEEPLPVELISFSAVQNGSRIILNWSTASETNNHGFEIERKTYLNENENEWSVIGFKTGVGTTSNMINYSFADELSETIADKISYRLKQIDFDGSFNFSDIVFIDNVLPGDFSLWQNYPNPFNPSTNIKFNLPQDEFVSLKVFNSLGKQVADIINERKNAGTYTIEFDASLLPSGVYYYKLSSGFLSDTKKMILIK